MSQRILSWLIFHQVTWMKFYLQNGQTILLILNLEDLTNIVGQKRKIKTTETMLCESEVLLYENTSSTSFSNLGILNSCIKRSKENVSFVLTLYAIDKGI